MSITVSGGERVEGKIGNAKRRRSEEKCEWRCMSRQASDLTVVGQWKIDQKSVMVVKGVWGHARADEGASELPMVDSGAKRLKRT